MLQTGQSRYGSCLLTNCLQSNSLQSRYGSMFTYKLFIGLVYKIYIYFLLLFSLDTDHVLVFIVQNGSYLQFIVQNWIHVFHKLLLIVIFRYVFAYVFLLTNCKIIVLAYGCLVSGKTIYLQTVYSLDTDPCLLTNCLQSRYGSMFTYKLFIVRLIYIYLHCLQSRYGSMFTYKLFIV